jgi:hypothetical protein
MQTKLTGHTWYIQEPLNGPTDLLFHTMSEIKHVVYWLKFYININKKVIAAFFNEFPPGRTYEFHVNDTYNTVKSALQLPFGDSSMRA